MFIRDYHSTWSSEKGGVMIKYVVVVLSCNNLVAKPICCIAASPTEQSRSSGSRISLRDLSCLLVVSGISEVISAINQCH